MKSEIKLLVLSKNKSLVSFKINRQTHRGRDFNSRLPLPNRMSSSIGPEIVYFNNSRVALEKTAIDYIFYTRGYDKSRDNDILTCDIETFEKIQDDVERFNKVNGC